MSEFGWVAMKEQGPWCKAINLPTPFPKGLGAGTVCGKWECWQHCARVRPPDDEICKRCLAAEER